MKKYLFIESEKARKNGHVTHVMCYDERSNDYYEVSPKTGKPLHMGLWISDLEGYKIINPLTESYCITGGLSFAFVDFLLDNPEYIITK